MFSPHQIITNLLSISHRYMRIISETRRGQQMITWLGWRMCLTRHYTNLCTQPTSVMFKCGWQTFAWTLRDKPLPSFHIFTLEVLFILLLIGLFIPRGSFWWFHAYYIFFNAGWRWFEYLASALWITAPSYSRCGVAKKLISPTLPQKDARVSNV